VGIGKTSVVRWRNQAGSHWRALVVASTALTLVISGGVLEARSAEAHQAALVSQGVATSTSPDLSSVRAAMATPSTAGPFASEAVHAVPPPPPPPAPAPAPARAKKAASASASAPKAVTVPEVLQLVNVERANAGLAPLVASGSLNNSSAAHASWMSANGTLQHSAYPGGTWGENIAQGYGSAQSVVAAWMNSPGHRANILNPAYHYMGLGYAAAGNYWCQQFLG
jgi:uncharacterized protein YkwD